MVKSKIRKGFLSFLLFVVFVYVAGGAQVDAYGMEPIEQSQEDLEPSDIKTLSDHGPVIEEGIFGSSPWILFENGTLEIGSGTLGAGRLNVPISQRTVVSRVIFTGEVIANANSSQLFSNFSNLKAIEKSYYLDTSSVTDMSRMFEETRSLNELDVSNWDTSSVTDMSWMFSFSNIRELDVSNWDTSSVTDMSLMFDFSNMNELDVSNWDTSSVTDMSWMFFYSNIRDLDVSNWDTSSVTDMSEMFSRASSLNKLDVSNWDTSSVTDMSFMFSFSNIRELDVSNWDTSSVTDMQSLFRVASSLNELDVSNWDTSSVRDMNSMFYLASNLNELDVSNWDTSSVTSIAKMFEDVSNIRELDVSNWDTSRVTNMNWMFRGTTNLSKLVLGEQSLFIWNTGLPEIVENDEFTGRWIGGNTQHAFMNSQQFMSEYKGDFPDTYVWERRDSEVIVKYVTEAGEELAPPTVLSGKVGLPFETEPKDIDEWFVIETPANTSGIFSREAQEVVYVYERTEDPEIKLTFLDFFPDENLALAVGNRFSRAITDEVTEEESNYLTGTINANYRNIATLKGCNI